MIIPFKTNSVKVTSAYGVRTLNGKKETHPGYDLVGIGSNIVVAAVGGKVVSSAIITDHSNLTWQWGNYVCVHGNDDRYYYYCHLASRAVKAGQIIDAGDVIGVMGNTGYSFGAHLHFEVRANDRRTPLCPDFILGITNKVGTYSLPKKTQLELDLDVLVASGVINSPKYWLKNADKLDYLPELIHNMAVKLGG